MVVAVGSATLPTLNWYLAAPGTLPQVKVTDSPMRGLSLLISILKHWGPTGGGDSPGGVEDGGSEPGGGSEAGGAGLDGGAGEEAVPQPL